MNFSAPGARLMGLQGPGIIRNTPSLHRAQGPSRRERGVLLYTGERESSWGVRAAEPGEQLWAGTGQKPVQIPALALNWKCGMAVTVVLEPL